MTLTPRPLVRAVRQPPTRCECGSRLTAGGCINADCWNWRGPTEPARECPHCGSTETVELHDGDRQSIAVCAGCGSDEP